MEIFFAALTVLAQISTTGLLQAALDPNPGLRSYIATAELVARTHPLPLSRVFRGTAYYVAPTRKIVFDNVSGLLSRFQTLTTTVPSYAQARQSYDVTSSSDDGRASTYTLVPRKIGGRVTSLVLSIDDGTALISRAVYHYSDGSVLSFDEHYETLGSFHVPASVDVAAHFPGYSVDGTIRFTNYRTNVAVPETVLSGT